jgi:iron complex outermembrane receptor protein
VWTLPLVLALGSLDAGLPDTEALSRAGPLKPAATAPADVSPPVASPAQTAPSPAGLTLPASPSKTPTTAAPPADSAAQPATAIPPSAPATAPVGVRPPATSPASATSDPAAGTPPESEPSGTSAAAAPRALTTTVRSRGSLSPSLVVGDLRLELGLLGERPRTSGTALLLLAPSVLLANHSGEGHAPQIFIRGFDAGEGKDLELRVEGVPLNEVSNAHSHGYADTSFLIPELVSALRVVEGPFSAAQGDFAVAGSVDFELGLRQRGVTVIGEYGQFNHQRLTALWGPKEHRETTFVGLTLRQGSGFGPNRAFANGSLLASHELRLPQDTRLRLLAGLSAGRFDSAGVLRFDDVEARRNPRCPATADGQFFCLTDPNQGGAQQRHFVSAELTSKLEAGVSRHQLFALFRQMRLRENFTGFVSDVPLPDAQGNAPALMPQRGDGIELRYGGVTAGVRGSWLQRFGDEASRRPALELGYVGRVDEVDSASRRLRAADGVPYRVAFDNRVTVTNLSLYAQGSLPLGARLAVSGGLRLDAFLFGVNDRNRPTADRRGARLADDALEAFGVMPSPRLATEVLLVKGLWWMTGFGLGARSSDAAALSDAEFAPFALVASAETGLRYLREGPVRLEARGAVFATRVQRDIVFEPDEGRNVPVGASNRVGAFGFARLTFEQRLDVTASVSYTRGHLPPAQSPWLALFDGPALPYVPRFLARLEAVGAHRVEALGQGVDLTAGLAVWAIGPRPLPFEQLSEPAVLVDASLRARWRWVSAGLIVDNVLDTRWRQAEFNYASNFVGPDAAPSRLAMRHFSAGPPRQWRLMLGLHFD